MLASLLGAMTEQTRAITQLVGTGVGGEPANEFSMLVDTTGSHRLTGARGSEKIVKLREEYIRLPLRITQTIRNNLQLNPVLGHNSLEQASMYTFFANHVPMGGAKTAAYMAFGMAAVSDLMHAQDHQHAEALLNLILVATESAALRNWRWEAAWTLTHQPPPPWQHISRAPPKSPLDCVPKLADPVWIAASIAKVQDLIAMDEAHKKITPPKGDGKGKGDDKGPG